MAVLAFQSPPRGTSLLPLLQGEGRGEDGVDLLYRAGQSLARNHGATPTGFAPLDAALPWGGFPRGALTEILLPASGLGEIELIAAAWAQLGARERLIFIAPPFVPYAPALRALWPLQRFVWIETDAAQAPWAAEQCLRSGCVGAVALWCAGGDDRRLRRLQLAAAEGGAHGFVFRPQRHAINPSPAALRLQLDATAGALRLHRRHRTAALEHAQAMQRERDFSSSFPLSRESSAFEGGEKVTGSPLSRG